MRFLQLSDTHLGVRRFVPGAPAGWSRADDHLAAMRAALDLALAQGVDLVLHTGDLFDRSRPPARVIAQAASLLVETARRVPVVVLAGNHDRRGLRPHLPLLCPGLHVVDQGERLVLAGIALAVVPFLADAQGWAAVARRAVGPGVDLLLCHQAVDGCQVPGFTFRAGAQRDTLGTAHLPPGAPAILSGHLHPRQALDLGGVPVLMPGSTERTSFGEASQPKGCLLGELGVHLRWRFVDLPTRPMVRVDAEDDLARVGPGALVRCGVPALDAAVKELGGWLCARPGPLVPAQRTPPQLRLFG